MDVAELELDTRLLGGLPIVNVFYERLGIDRLLDGHVAGDTRLRLSPSAALGVVIRNLLISHAPVYALGEWAAGYDASVVGLATDEVGLLNDDRVGRMLGRLFDADRASLLTRLVLDAVQRFDIDLSRLHNDSSAVKFTGAYAAADGRKRGGKPTPAVNNGQVRVLGWSGPNSRTWSSSSTVICSIASCTRPTRPSQLARLLRVVRVLGWSAPNSCVQSLSNTWSCPMAWPSCPRLPYAMATV